jgi:hypothetical protein
MVDPRKIGQFLMGEWNKTSQPLKERASVLPLGQYEDGSVGLAWPGLLAAPAEGVANFGTYGYGEDAVPFNSRMAFDAAGGAMTGGLGVGMAGGMVDNALGSAGGKLARGASDLPMDLASRMARAKEMGFDTDRVLYHGTKSDFDEFAPTRGDYGEGVYLTPSSYIANQYAGWTDGANVRPVYARGDLTEVNGGNTVLVSDPSNIRSVNAAFDPAKIDSSNLLAANAKSGAAIPLGMEGQEQDPALVEYLKAIGLY